MYIPKEISLFRKLDTPKKIQDFLNTIPFNFEKKSETCYSPRLVLRNKTAHCMEGALFAVAAMEYHGKEPLVMDLRSARNDFDHVVAVFKQFGCYGAMSKTNHAVLRYREPVYKTIRELVMSYFHEYFLDNGKKTLRDYSEPVNIDSLHVQHWQTAEHNLFEIPQLLDKRRHYAIVSLNQIRNFRSAEDIEIRAGKIVDWKK